MQQYVERRGWSVRVRFFTKIQIRILIRKRIFRFFTKIQKRIIDENDPQQRWILPGLYSKPDTFDT